MLLYINGQLAELDAGQVIAQTKQVNDLNSLDNRQTNYTNKFRLPKTATNIRIMNFLTLTGNDSNIPYQKNECSLYSDNGECFVYNGWAVVTDGGESYEVVVYDGIIDLYKAIENKSLADLDLKKLTHEKNITTIITTWVGDTILPYKYILADFNGKSDYTPGNLPSINIDYLVPSVHVPWLYEKIFEVVHDITGYGYEGKVFESDDFKNLWMTYPMGIKSVENEDLLFESSNYGFTGEVKQPYNYIRKYFARFIDTQENSGGITNHDNTHLIVPETARYKLEISGKLNTKKYVYTYQGNPSGTIPSDCTIVLGKNAQSKSPLTLPASETLLNGLAQNREFSKTLFLSLNKGDAICLGISATSERPYNIFTIDSGSSLTVKLTKIEAGVFDFDTTLSDFSMRDFLNEIVHRFGLTMYKDTTTKKYIFLTLKELLEQSEIANWSGKFAKKISENYLYSNYAQQNWLRYNYNEKESSYNDSFIPLSNLNIAENRDVIKSKIYSPEKTQVNYLNRKTNVYKLWDKEVDRDTETNAQTINYKSLDKRYYFLRQEKVQDLIMLKSDLLADFAPFSYYFCETFVGLKFSDIVSNYYITLQKILDKARIVTAELFLKDTDIINLDFKKRYYIEQLGGNFLMNKITNYVPGKPVRCELIKVSNEAFEPFTIKITRVVVNLFTVEMSFQASETVDGVVIEYQLDNMGWVSLPWNGSSPATITLNRGYYNLQVRANGQLSNKVTVMLPAARTVIIP